MLLANLHDFLTEFRWQSMEFVQSANVPKSTSTRTSLSCFDVLAPDACMTGPRITQLSGLP